MSSFDWTLGTDSRWWYRRRFSLSSTSIIFKSSASFNWTHWTYTRWLVYRGTRWLIIDRWWIGRFSSKIFWCIALSDLTYFPCSSGRILWRSIIISFMISISIPSIRWNSWSLIRLFINSFLYSFTNISFRWYHLFNIRPFVTLLPIPLFCSHAYVTLFCWYHSRLIVCIILLDEDMFYLLVQLIVHLFCFLDLNLGKLGRFC